jgi:hypothetical protein
VPFVVLHPVFEANRMEVSKVQPKFWHVVMAKLHDQPLIELVLFVRLWLCIMKVV